VVTFRCGAPLQASFEILPESSIAREIGVDEVLGLAGGDVQLIRETERRHAYSTPKLIVFAARR